MTIDWKEIVLVFMMAAEAYITGTKKGAERKAWVIDQVYSLLPEIVTKLLPRETLEDLIENSMSELRKRLQAEVG